VNKNKKNTSITFFSKIASFGLAVIVLLLIGNFKVVENAHAAGWFNANWEYRKMITIDSDEVTGTANHTNFPVLIRETDVDLKDTVNGGNVGQSDGGDIVFTKDDGTTQLDHEIELYVDSTGEFAVSNIVISNLLLVVTASVVK